MAASVASATRGWRRRFRARGNQQREGGAARRAVYLHASAVLTDDPVDETQAEPAPMHAAIHRMLAAIERLEDARQVGFGNAGAMIGDRDAHHRGRRRERCGRRPSGRPAVLDGVRDQVLHRAGQRGVIGAHQKRPVGRLEVDVCVGFHQQRHRTRRSPPGPPPRRPPDGRRGCGPRRIRQTPSPARPSRSADGPPRRSTGRSAAPDPCLRPRRRPGSPPPIGSPPAACGVHATRRRQTPSAARPACGRAHSRSPAWRCWRRAAAARSSSRTGCGGVSTPPPFERSRLVREVGAPQRLALGATRFALRAALALHGHYHASRAARAPHPSPAPARQARPQSTRSMTALPPDPCVPAGRVDRRRRRSG